MTKWTDFKKKKAVSDYLSIRPEWTKFVYTGKGHALCDEVWENSRYFVLVYHHGNEDEKTSCRHMLDSEGNEIEITHLSIKSNDNNHLAHDWRDMQRIKNEICGPEREAIEIYPAMSRLIDTTNQFHLWVFPEGYPISIGYNYQMVISSQEKIDSARVPFAKQRNMEDGFWSEEE